MMNFTPLFFFSIVALAGLIIGTILFAMMKFYRKVEQGKALIVNKIRDVSVTFSGAVVFPIVHKAEVMDISLKTIEIDRRGHEGLICGDNIRADIKVTFFVRVNKTGDDVLRVAQAIGCERASDRETMNELFNAKFSEALKTVGKQLQFEDLYKERDSFRDKIIEIIGKDLNGYVLEDAAIDYLEQTPVDSLDPDNILDAQGIRKITELTAIQHVQTNEFENQERMKITQQNVVAKEAVLEMERRQADAEAKQQREIANVRAKEQAEIDSVASEEKKRSEHARLQTEEEIEVRNTNKIREVEVAEQNRQRVVAIEQERVKLAQEQEIVAREREIALQEIAKEKALEQERREIAAVIRERISVEKTVAQEEEQIKELRLVSEAERTKKSLVIQAEAEAEEGLVKDIKAAEASEQAARYRAQEQIALAEAEREVADKQAQAQMRLAEGKQADAAAEGLATVRVKEANALAIEKQGAAEAKASLDKFQAEASGKEQLGLATVRVKEAEAVAIEKQGTAQAKAHLEQMQAEASGKEADAVAVEKLGVAEAKAELERLLAEASGKEAEAAATEKQGIAEAHALQAQLEAEAAGLAEKFKALDALSDKGRAHEEFRLEQEQERKRLAIDWQGQEAVANKRAEILAEALKHADIDIVGGEQMFFDRLVGATSQAKAVDSFMDNSQTGQALLKDYLNDKASFTEDLKTVLTGVSSEDLSNLSASAFLSQLLKNSSAEQRDTIKSVLKSLQKKS